MNPITPQTGYQLCAADDPQRTHYIGCANHKTPGKWHPQNNTACIGCNQHWQKPIPLPDGKAPSESAWEFVPEDEYSKVPADLECMFWSGREWNGLENASRSTFSQWLQAYCIKAFARRKSKPGVDKLAVEAGYRLLEVGEIVQEGDEVVAGRGWVKVSATIGQPLEHCSVGAFRRKIVPPVAFKSGEWRSIKESGIPTEEGRYWCWDGSKLYHYLIPRYDTSWAGITHWTPCDEPTPPAPEPTDAEIAFEKSWLNDGDLSEVITERKKGFLAGYAAKGAAK